MSEFKEGDRLSRLKTAYIRYWPDLSCYLVDLDSQYLTPSDKVLVVGSGRIPKVVVPDVVNVDIQPFDAVSVVTDAQRLCFASNAFDAVVCHQVLEHVPDADSAVSQMYRVLKPGGKIIATVPFYFPLHASPFDFRRWTISGLRITFRRFEEIDSGMHVGPTSAILTGVQHLSGLLAPGFYPSLLIKGVVGYLLFVFKYLDLVIARLPKAIHLAASVYFVGRKPLSQVSDE